MSLGYYYVKEKDMLTKKLFLITSIDKKMN